jgi:hypothetical protein
MAFDTLGDTSQSGAEAIKGEAHGGEPWFVPPPARAAYSCLSPLPRRGLLTNLLL